MYKSVSAFTKFIVLLFWLFCFSVIVVGSWRLVVVNIIQVSVLETSSSFKLVACISGGGSIGLQEKFKIIGNRKRNNALVFITVTYFVNFKKE